MVINPEYKPLTLEQIRAENERIARATKPEALPVAAPKIPAERHIATLKNRIARFKTYPAPDAYELPLAQQKQKPRCERCNNLGVIRYDVPSDHALYRKDIPCDAQGGCPVIAYHQGERAERLSERETRHFGKIIEYFPSASMGDYLETDRRRPVGAARLFLQHGEMKWNDTMKRSLVYYGKAGRGKTHLASAIRNTLVARGEAVIFRKMRSLLKAVQRGYSDNAEMRDYEVEEMLSKIPYLFIDELETELKTDDRVDIFEAVIDHRYRENLPTIITTNLEQDEIHEKMNYRIESRLVHMAHWIEMGGESQRDTGAPIRSK